MPHLLYIYTFFFGTVYNTLMRFQGCHITQRLKDKDAHQMAHPFGRRSGFSCLGRTTDNLVRFLYKVFGLRLFSYVFSIGIDDVQSVDVFNRL
ncbi:unnamed protein product [Lactuca virosa]|uniref:Secreted protein n=1 Tax=Lactuca virosa TaxID=75947 RepID=A0AAU9PUG6_9ASTR|nr:unnamed protein product [Lactuca virosa]